MQRKRAAVITGTLVVLVMGPVQPASPASATRAVPSSTATSTVEAGTARPAGRGFRDPIVTGKRRQVAKRLSSRPGAANAAKVTIDVYNRHGKPPATADAEEAYFVPLAGGDWLGAELDNGHAEGNLPAGDYAVWTHVKTQQDHGATSSSLVYLPKVSVKSGAKVVLDSRKARKFDAAADHKDARMLDGIVFIDQEIGGKVQPTAIQEGSNVYVTPSTAAAGLAVRAQATLTRNGAEDGSPYAYHLAKVTQGKIPESLRIQARTKDLATVRTRYGREGGKACGGSHAGAAWSTGISWAPYVGAGALPTKRDEYFTPGVAWNLSSGITTPDCAFDDDRTDIRNRTERFQKPGSYSRNWHIGPFGPFRGTAIWGTGDGEPALAVGMLATWSSSSFLAPYAGTTGTSTLRDADGKVVASSDQPGRAHNWPAPKPGKYTLSIDAKRKAPWSGHTSRQHARWTITVQNAEPLTLPGIRVRTRLDGKNRAPARAKQAITLATTRDTAGKTVSLRVSDDAGKTWNKVPLIPSGKHWTGSFRNPGSGHVSLRITAAGAVDQTLIRAYGIR